MSRLVGRGRAGFQRLFAVLVACTAAIHCGAPAEAQFDPGFGNFFQNVGGMRIDPSGSLVISSDQLNAELRQQLEQRFGDVHPAVAQQADMRMISLRGIETAMQNAAATGEDLPDVIKFMGGITRIQYVFLYPERNDIVLAGPGEGWKVDGRGNVVGQVSGQPVLRLEDFIVAMRSVDNARRDQGISVSIDPTEEGLQRLQALYSRIGDGFNPSLASVVEEAMGPQPVSLTGVPVDSRFAQVLVVADFKMKRLAMGFDPAPVAEFPSVLEIAQQRGRAVGMSPRFWMECHYEPIKRSEEGLSWKISGPGAKALTEEEAMTQQGQGQRRSHPIAKRWAETMTEKFKELAKADPVFAELRNMMDMSVVAALIRKEDMLRQIDLELPLLLEDSELVNLPEWNSPQSVPAHCSYALIGGRWMVTASGGIQVDSWSVLDELEVDQSLEEARQLAASSQPGDSIWWNGR